MIDSILQKGGKTIMRTRLIALVLVGALAIASVGCVALDSIIKVKPIDVTFFQDTSTDTTKTTTQN